MAENAFGLSNLLKGKLGDGGTKGNPSAAIQLDSVVSPASAGIKVEFLAQPEKIDNGSGKMIDTIEKQQFASAQPKFKSILGNTVELQKSLEVEREVTTKKRLRMVKFAFVGALILMIGFQGYLSYQLSPGINFWDVTKINFDQNLYNGLANQNQNIRAVQTNINKYRYLTSQLNLNEFSLYSSKFLDGVKQLQQIENLENKNDLQNSVTEAQIQLPKLLLAIKQNLVPAVSIELYEVGENMKKTPEEMEALYETDLKNAFLEDKKKLQQNNAVGAADLALQDSLRILDNATKLVGNKKLISALNRTSVEKFTNDLDGYLNAEDPTQNQSLRGLINTILSSTKIDLATIGAIKSNRIQWNSVIARIDAISNKVKADHNANSSNNAELVYSGYELNSDSNKIVLSGVNTTSAGTNTTVVSYLIDEFEKSPYFNKVTNRSFPKSKTVNAKGETVYSTSFKIELGLEKETTPST